MWLKKCLSARLARVVMPRVKQAYRKKTQAVEKSVAVPTKAIIDRYKKKKKRYQLFESVSFECLVDSKPAFSPCVFFRWAFRGPLSFPACYSDSASHGQVPQSPKKSPRPAGALRTCCAASASRGSRRRFTLDDV
jgi:hypothetical protein